MSTHANMVKMTVTSVGADPYTITLNAASSGFQSFADAYGANATVDILITQGTVWEVARNCTYTHSGTTVSRGTFEDSSTGSRIATFDNTAVVSVVATADSGRRWDSAGLQTLAVETVVGSNVTGLVGKMHRLDIDGMTAARAFVLPTAAATDDRIGVFCTTDAPTTHAYVLQIKSGAAGDLINGTDHSSTIWSSLLIKGECLIFRCIDGSTVDWIVEYDGRIPCNTAMEAASQQTGIADSAWVTITKGATGSWATPINVGACADATNHAVITRRAGNYVLSAGVAIEALIDARSILIGFRKNATGSPKRCGRLDTGYNVSTLQIVGSVAVAAAAGDSYDAQVLHLDATTTRNTEYIAGESMSTIRLVEVL